MEKVKLEKTEMNAFIANFKRIEKTIISFNEFLTLSKSNFNTFISLFLKVSLKRITIWYKRKIQGICSQGNGSQRNQKVRSWIFSSANFLIKGILTENGKWERRELF